MPVSPVSPVLDEARALGLGRAAELFPEDVIAAHTAAMANRSLLQGYPPPVLEPWQPPGPHRA